VSAQTTLTEDAPMILDATCSDLKIWPKEASIRIDIDRNVKPDIVASASSLLFRDGVFDAIYCDLPHCIRSEGHFTGNGMWGSYHGLQRFSFWKSKAEWLDFLRGTNVDFSRCLKEQGILHYKIASNTNGDPRMVKLNDLELMDRFTTEEWRVTKSPTPWSTAFTHWLTMKPIKNIGAIRDDEEGLRISPSEPISDGTGPTTAQSPDLDPAPTQPREVVYNEYR
jgi:hypothetical protein